MSWKLPKLCVHLWTDEQEDDDGSDDFYNESYGAGHHIENKIP